MQGKHTSFVALGETVKVFEGILNRNYEVTDASQKTRKRTSVLQQQIFKIRKTTGMQRSHRHPRIT